MNIKIIDSGGNDVGCIRRELAIKYGLRHQIVRLILISKDGNSILLQQRSKLKDSCPNMWDSSASGHVDAHEEVTSAIIRETKEEIGLKIDQVKLEYVGTYDTNEKLTSGILQRQTLVFSYLADISDLTIKIDSIELNKTEWVEVSVLKDLTSQSQPMFQGEKLTKGLVNSLKLLFDRISETS